jgi:hypothetical protein
MSFVDSPLDLHVRAHTIQTEHRIRDTTRVASQTTSAAKREGMMRATFKDRKQKPQLESKKDFTSFTAKGKE